MDRQDWIKLGKGMGSFIGVIAVILLTSLTGSWVVMTVSTSAACGAMAKIATKGSLKNILGWAAIGAIAGLGFWAAL